MAAVLDDDRDRNLGRPVRGVTDEPGVVLGFEPVAAWRSPFAAIRTTCAVPVFPATASPGTRAADPVPPGSFTTPQSPSRIAASVSGFSPTVRSTIAAPVLTVEPEPSATLRMRCGR